VFAGPGPSNGLIIGFLKIIDGLQSGWQQIGRQANRGKLVIDGAGSFPAESNCNML